MRQLIDDRQRAGHDTLDFLQGFVSSCPPSAAVDMFRTLDFLDPKLHILAPVPGISELREAIAEYRGESIEESIDAENVLITAGANNAFFAAVTAMCDPGQSVMLLSPYFFNHAMSLNAAGIRIVECPLDESRGFQPDLSRILDAWNSNTVGLVVTNPNNPTGTLMESSELAEISSLVQRKSGFLIVDESYLHFKYGTRLWPDLRYSLTNTVLIGSLSKSLSMAGERIGYVIAHKELLPSLAKLQDLLIISAPTISQILATAALRDRESHLARVVPMLNQRRLLLKRRLERIPCFSTVHGDAAIFLFAKLRTERDSMRFARTLLQYSGVATTPGDAFGAAGNGYIRFAYGGVDESQIERGCDLIEQFADD